MRILFHGVPSRLLVTQALGVLVQPGKHGLKLVDVHIGDALEELAANFFKAGLQLWRNTPAPVGGPDDKKPSIVGVTPPGE